MKKQLFLVMAVMAIICCRQIKEENESEIINDCFISITDTLGYYYHTLLPIPQDSAFTKSDSLDIGVYPKLVSLRKWVPEIKIILDTVTLKEEYFLLLDKSTTDSADRSLDVAAITKKGKYDLVAETNRYARRMKGRIGSLVFSRVYYDEASGRGLVVAEIADNHKAGIVKLLLLEKSKTQWKVLNDFVLEVW